jgi:hypothetical protein
MANDITYRIPNVKDDVLIELALKAFELAGEIPDSSNPRLHVRMAGEQVQFDSGQREPFDEMLEAAREANGYFVNSISIAVNTPRQNNNNESISFTISRPESGAEPTAALRVQLPNGSGIAKRVPAVQKVVAVFEPIDPMQSAIMLSKGDEAAYLKELEAQLQRLSNLALEQTERVTTSLRDQTAENSKILQAEQDRLQADFDKRLGQLDEREKELDQRAEGLDLADAKTSRRRLREQLREKLDKLAADFALTKQTTSERKTLMRTLLVALAVAGALVVQAGYSLNHDATHLPTLLRLFGSSALFGGLLIYFIRWQSAWVRHRTAEELRLLNTNLDIERASWILESLIELHGEDIKDMPDALLEAVTRNLFVQPGELQSVNTPIDDLADILRDGAESVRIKQGDSEIVLDRKGLKRLRAASEKAEAAGAKE